MNGEESDRGVFSRRQHLIPSTNGRRAEGLMPRLDGQGCEGMTVEVIPVGARVENGENDIPSGVES